MFIYHGHVIILIFITLLFKGAEPSQFSWIVPKKSRKAPPRRIQNIVVLTQEMDVADSMEVTEGSIIIPAPLETVSTVSSSQC